MPGQDGAKPARHVELARQLACGAERDVLFVEPVRADRAGIDAAMPGIDRDDVQRPGPPRETRLLFAVRLARRLGGERAAAAGARHGDAGHERAKRPPRDDPVPHPPAPPDRPRDKDDHRADYDGAEGVTPDRGRYARSARLSGGLSSVRRKTTHGAGSTRPKPRRNPA